MQQEPTFQALCNFHRELRAFSNDQFQAIDNHLCSCSLQIKLLAWIIIQNICIRPTWLFTQSSHFPAAPHLCIYCAQLLAVSRTPETQAASSWLAKSHSQRKQANYNEALTECLHIWGKHAVLRAKEKECQGGRWLNRSCIPRPHFS